MDRVGSGSEPGVRVCTISFSSSMASLQKDADTFKRWKNHFFPVQLVLAVLAASFRAFTHISYFIQPFVSGFVFGVFFFLILFIPSSIKYLALVQLRAQFGHAGTHVKFLNCHW